MKSYAQVLFLAIPLAIVPAAFAQHETFTVNPDTSQVAFTLGAAGTMCREHSIYRADRSPLTQAPRRSPAR